MTADVTIPADVARDIASELRAFGGRDTDSTNDWRRRLAKWADLLDPKPPTLREKVADALAPFYTATPAREHERSAADAVLAVVWARIDALQTFDVRLGENFLPGLNNGTTAMVSRADIDALFESGAS